MKNARVETTELYQCISDQKGKNTLSDFGDGLIYSRKLEVGKINLIGNICMCVCVCVCNEAKRRRKGRDTVKNLETVEKEMRAS